MNPEQQILVLPRSVFSGFDRFMSARQIQQENTDLGAQSRWMIRMSAEESVDWVQPIPVALIKGPGGYCVLRRIKETRADLKSRLSLVVGGHIDKELEGQSSIESLLVRTLHRELEEEVGLTADDHELAGIVIDNSSILSSRHVAFVFIVEVKRSVKASAPEEFAQYSKYSGKFLPVPKLIEMKEHFDPWSTVLIEDYLAPSCGVAISRQSRLPLPID